MESKIESAIAQSIKTKQLLLEDENLISKIALASSKIIQTIQKGGKVLIAGNGGSAADSQHFAAELVGKFYRIRKALPAIALSTNTSILTAVGNDVGFDVIFARQLEALGGKGDVFIGISTSGNSANIVNAVEKAKELGLFTIALTGKSGGKLIDLADITINVPSSDTPRIQESHILILHIIAQLVEDALCTS